METAYPYQFNTPTGRTVMSPTGSPWTFTNLSGHSQMVTVSGGTVLTIEFAGAADTFDLVGLLGGNYVLPPGARLRLGYLVAPSVVVRDI